MHSPDYNAVVQPRTESIKASLQLARHRRKLEQRDRRISGLERRIVELQARLSTATHFEHDLVRAVQTALANVRMIPTFGPGSASVRLDVKPSYIGKRGEPAPDQIVRPDGC